MAWSAVRRGDIAWIDLDPARGREQHKVRPAIVVSNDAAVRAVLQRNDGMFTVIPLTSNTKQVLSFQVLLPAARTGLSEDSKAQVEQIRSVDYSRVSGELAGRLPVDLMLAVDHALRRHLAL
jgi:mRNA interferase MazF